MLENEAAYKKVSQERENVHRMMKTTFDPNQIARQREAENFMQAQNKKRGLSVDGILKNQWINERSISNEGKNLITPP